VNQCAATAADNSAARWGEAAELRREYPGWVVIWLAAFAEFRAYRRMPGARHVTVLTAATSQEIAAQIDQAQRAARLSRPFGVSSGRAVVTLPEVPLLADDGVP
jgi:hypothetical protein